MGISGYGSGRVEPLGYNFFVHIECTLDERGNDHFDIEALDEGYFEAVQFDRAFRESLVWRDVGVCHRGIGFTRAGIKDNDYYIYSYPLYLEAYRLTGTLSWRIVSQREREDEYIPF